MSKDDFKYLSNKFHTNALDLVKQKRFYPYEYMSGFENCEYEIKNKEKFHSSLTGKKLAIKNMNMYLSFRVHFKWKQSKIITTCT